MSTEDYEFTCFKTVKKECADLTMPWGEDWTFQALTNDLMDSSNALMKFIIGYYSETWSENTLRAMNSLRCILSSSGQNSWYWLASAYWTLVAMGAGSDVNVTVDWVYRQVCTCHSDIEELRRIFGGNERSAHVFGSCSEEQSNKKLQAQKDAVENEEDRIEAAKVAVK
jgi:hypothetical protein